MKRPEEVKLYNIHREKEKVIKNVAELISHVTNSWIYLQDLEVCNL